MKKVINVVLAIVILGAASGCALEKSGESLYSKDESLPEESTQTDENAYTLKGEKIPEEMLETWDFSAVVEIRMTNNSKLADFLDSLESVELKKVYEKAFAISTLGMNDYSDLYNEELLTGFYGEDYLSSSARIYDNNGLERGRATGYTYESVKAAFKNTFTDEYAIERLNDMNLYCYENELFVSEHSGGRPGLIQEYEIITKTDEKTIIRETCWVTDEDGNATDVKEFVNENVFVKTDGTWKCSSFSLVTPT